MSLKKLHYFTLTEITSHCIKINYCARWKIALYRKGEYYDIFYLSIILLVRLYSVHLS